MKLHLPILAFLPIALSAPAAQPIQRASKPTVSISSPKATIIGAVTKVESFYGIPFAQPPVASLRLKPPQPLTSALGTVYATGVPAACPQMFFNDAASDLPSAVLGTLLNTPLFQTITFASEDCLTVNVQRPIGTTAKSKLPVLFWIFGGGFELGSTLMYDGANFVLDSITDGQPIIFVAVNYRVGGFGFMPGAEILADGSSNLGLLDQRLGLQWVQDNIAAFGGDPTKVTIWGESAGAISVLDQMAMYDGDISYKGSPLFRGAIMNSGSIVPAGPIDSPKGQAVFNQVVKTAGCTAATDKLACLRALPYSQFLTATNSVPGLLSYSSVDLSYLPRPDGVVLTASPDALIANGKYAPVPFIIGDQEDEGTIFALFQSNITTTSQLVNYLQSYFFNDATTAEIAALVATYPDNASDGSPFNTSILYELYPQFKRLAAILGDMTFTLTRRIFLSTHTALHPTVPAWSYLSSYDYGTPILGTFHGSDLLQVFYGILPNYASVAVHRYYYNFIYNLDPNDSTAATKKVSVGNWPKWSAKEQVLQIWAATTNLLDDDFRQGSYEWLANNVGILRI